MMQQDRSSHFTTREDFPRHSTTREEHSGTTQLERSPNTKTRELNIDRGMASVPPQAAWFLTTAHLDSLG